MSFSALRDQPIARQYSRDSFDRFGDDLCEELLSFLFFRDKLRLQCVAKQWKRLILNKQSVLSVTDSIRRWNNVKDIQCNDENVMIREPEEVIREDRLKVLLIMCPNIRKIKFNARRVRSSVLDTIVDCCPRLETIDGISLCDISREAIERFGQKFGQWIKSIGFKDSAHRRIQYSLLDMCPNLEFLSCDDLMVIGDESSTVLKRLKKLRYVCHTVSDDLISRINSFAPNLKTIEFQWHYSYQSVQYTCKSSQMPSIKRLKFMPSSADGSLISDVHRLAPNCRTLELFGDGIISDNSLQLLSIIGKKLSNLFVRDYSANTDSVTDSGIRHLLDIRPQLKKLHLLLRVNRSSHATDNGPNSWLTEGLKANNIFSVISVVPLCHCARCKDAKFKIAANCHKIKLARRKVPTLGVIHIFKFNNSNYWNLVLRT